MRDAYNRLIDYMRISITDRCNLRCGYCTPDELSFLSHEDILRYEELLKICTAAANIGIKHIKITGGEPLVRKGCVDFIRELKKLPGIEHVTLTTNGILLGAYIAELRDIGLDGVNISIDSLNDSVYHQITGSNMLPAVLESLKAAVDAGLRVKVNSVIINNLNKSEIASLAHFAQISPVQVRFIELMPVIGNSMFEPVSGDEILNVLRSVYPDLATDESKHGFGPARYFKSAELIGGIGLINAFGDHFCGLCNRVRLTSEGFLKLCLYHDRELDLRTLVRGGADILELEKVFVSAIQAKPEGHFESTQNPQMSRIGG